MANQTSRVLFAFLEDPILYQAIPSTTDDERSGESEKIEKKMEEDSDDDDLLITRIDTKPKLPARSSMFAGSVKDIVKGFVASVYLKAVASNSMSSLKNTLKLLGLFFLQQSYILALVGLYFSALQRDVTIFNSVYRILFFTSLLLLTCNFSDHFHSLCNVNTISSLRLAFVGSVL